MRTVESYNFPGNPGLSWPFFTEIGQFPERIHELESFRGERLVQGNCSTSWDLGHFPSWELVLRLVPLALKGVVGQNLQGKNDEWNHNQRIYHVGGSCHGYGDERIKFDEGMLALNRNTLVKWGKRSSYSSTRTSPTTYCHWMRWNLPESIWVTQKTIVELQSDIRSALRELFEQSMVLALDKWLGKTRNEAFPPFFICATWKKCPDQILSDRMRDAFVSSANCRSKNGDES